MHFETLEGTNNDESKMRETLSASEPSSSSPSLPAGNSSRIPHQDQFANRCLTPMIPSADRDRPSNNSKPAGVGGTLLEAEEVKLRSIVLSLSLSLPLVFPRVNYLFCFPWRRGKEASRETLRLWPQARDLLSQPSSWFGPQPSWTDLDFC